MGSIAEAFRTGGSWMFIILALLLMGLMWAPLGFLLAATKRRTPWPLWAAMPLGAWLVGQLGASMGAQELARALERAPIDLHAALIARGLGDALNVQVFGTMTTVILCAAGAAALGLGGVLGAGSPRRMTLAPAMSALLFGAGAAAVCGAWAVSSQATWFGPATLSAAILGAALVCAMSYSTSGVQDEDLTRNAVTRLGVASLTALGLPALAMMNLGLMKIQGFQALALADPAQRMELVAQLLRQAQRSWTLAGILALSGLALAIVPALPRLKRAVDTRSLAGAALGLAMMVITAGGVVALAQLERDALKTVTPPERAIDLLGALGAVSPGRLAPALTAELGSHDGRCVLYQNLEGRWTLAPGSARQDDPEACVATADDLGREALDAYRAWTITLDEEGCPSQAGPLTGPLCGAASPVVIYADDKLASALLGHPWGAGPRRLPVAVMSPPRDAAQVKDPLFKRLAWSGLSVMTLIWHPPSQAPWGAKRAQIALLDAASQDEALSRHAFDLQGLPQARRARVIVPDPSWSLGKVVEACAALREVGPSPPRDGDEQGLSCHVWSSATSAQEALDALAAASAQDAAQDPLDDDAPAEDAPAADATSQGGHTPILTPGKPTLVGSLPPEVIARVVRQHRSAVRICYERELRKDPKLSGEVTMRFTIAANGGVAVAQVARSTLKNPEVERCLTDLVRRWTFPKPKGGGVVMVSYPFRFSAASP